MLQVPLEPTLVVPLKSWRKPETTGEHDVRVMPHDLHQHHASFWVIRAGSGGTFRCHLPSKTADRRQIISSSFSKPVVC